jgi:hypothetical protein
LESFLFGAWGHLGPLFFRALDGVHHTLAHLSEASVLTTEHGLPRGLSFAQKPFASGADSTSFFF